MRPKEYCIVQSGSYRPQPLGGLICLLSSFLVWQIHTNYSVSRVWRCILLTRFAGYGHPDQILAEPHPKPSSTTRYRLESCQGSGVRSRNHSSACMHLLTKQVLRPSTAVHSAPPYLTSLVSSGPQELGQPRRVQQLQTAALQIPEQLPQERQAGERERGGAPGPSRRGEP